MTERTPEREHVGRSGRRPPGEPLDSGFTTFVPGAELSVEARERLRRKDEESRRARRAAMAEASTYVIGAR